METRLPGNQDYYRLSQARALRAKAGRVEGWSELLELTLLVAGLGSSLVGWLGGVWFLGTPPPASRFELLAVLPFGGAAAAAAALALPHLRWAPMDRYRRQAAALEAEHRARHGDAR